MFFSPERGQVKAKHTNDENKETFNKKEWFALVGMGIVSTILCAFFNMSGDIQSDIVSYTMWGHDIASGNPLLSGWIMPTNTFYFLSLLCAIIGSILGFNAILSSIVAALVYSLSTILTCFIILKLNKSRKSSWLMVFTIFGISVIPFDSLWGGAHVDIAIFILLAFYLIYSAEYSNKKECCSKLGIAYFLLAFGAFSDNLVLYYGIASIITVFTLKYIFGGHYKSNRFFCVLNIGLAIIATSVAILVPKIIKKLGGFELAGYSKPSFVSTKDIGARIIGVFQDIISQFGVNFSGAYVISYQSIVALSNLVIFIILVVLAVMHYKQKVNINTFALLAIFSIIICLCMLIFMNYETIDHIYTLYTVRLLRVQFFLMLVLFGSVDVKIYAEKIHINRSVQFIIIAGLLIISLFARIDHISFNGKSEGTFDRICKVLQENNLSNGFGTYWYSHAVTVKSELTNVVYPISGEKPQRFRWISKKVPNDIYANFVILKDNDKEFPITKELLIRYIGLEPAKTFRVDDVSIYVWNINIAPFFSNLLDNSYAMIYGASMSGNKDAIVLDNSRVLHKGGIMYGPYISANQGNYHVDIHGSNLEMASCDINSEAMNKNSKIVYKITKQTENEAAIDFTLPEAINDLEIRVFNNTNDKNITVDKIEITK